MFAIKLIALKKDESFALSSFFSFGFGKTTKSSLRKRLTTHYNYNKEKIYII